MPLPGRNLPFAVRVVAAKRAIRNAPPAYAPCAFYVVEDHDGRLEGVYAPDFNPYDGEEDTRQ